MNSLHINRVKKEAHGWYQYESRTKKEILAANNFVPVKSGKPPADRPLSKGGK
jgi:hypothetical protein